MSRSLAFIDIADAHLQETTWVDRRGLRGDAFYSFEQIVDDAIEQRCPIVANGDLINRRRNESGVPEFIRRQMNRLEKAGLDFFYIQGQHELQYPTPWFSALHDLPQWLDYQHGKAKDGLSINGIRVAGLDWHPAESLKLAFEQMPKADVLVMHQVCREFMGGIAAAEMTFDMVPHAQLLLIGDFHEHRTFETAGLQGQPLQVLSPGSTCMQKISETPEKAYFYIYDDLSFESVPLKTRRFYASSPLVDDDQLDELLASLPELIAGLRADAVTAGLPPDLQMPILDITYSDALNNAYRRITRVVGDSAHLFLKVLPIAPVSLQAHPREAIREAAENGLLGCLPFIVDKAEYPMAFSILQRLLSTPDGEERKVLQEIRDEYGLTQMGGGENG